MAISSPGSTSRTTEAPTMSRAAVSLATTQAAQRGLVEDLADQAEVLVDDHGRAVGHRDPGRLLTAVLEGVQTEIGQLRDLLTRRPDTEDATGVLRSRILGIEVVRQPSITARHLPSVPARTTVPGAGGVRVATVPCTSAAPTPRSCAMLDPADRSTPCP